MKNYGAIRKLMLMLLLSVLGSYCIGSERSQDQDASLIHSAYEMVVSAGNYCYKICSELVHKVMAMFGSEQDVKIQNLTGEVTSDDHYCTDGKEDCEENEHVFEDTWNYTGKSNFDQLVDLNIDPATV